MRGSIVKRGTGFSIVYRALDPKTGTTKQKWVGGFATKRAAEAALKDIVATIDAGTYTEPTKITLEAFVTETWLPSLTASGLRPSTVSMYERSARRYVLPHLGAQQLRNVRPFHLTAWLTGLRAQGLGDRTIEIAGVTAHKLLKSAVDLEVISRNPADNSTVRAARPRASAPEPVIWTADQTRTFLDSQRDDRLSALWRLAAMTGLRRGELAGLRWADLDLEAGTLRVSATRVVVDYKVIASEPKTEGSRRTIALDPATVAALKGHRSRQREERMKWGIPWDLSGLVFTRENGEGYHPQRFTQMLAARAKKAGLPPIKLHALRHGHATTALEAGVPLKVVSDRLGHSSIAITADTYSHVSVEVDRAAADQIAAVVDLG